VAHSAAPFGVPVTANESGTPKFPHCIGRALPNDEVAVRPFRRPRTVRNWYPRESTREGIRRSTGIDRPVKAYPYRRYTRSYPVNRGAVRGRANRRPGTLDLRIQRLHEADRIIGRRDSCRESSVPEARSSKWPTHWSPWLHRGRRSDVTSRASDDED